MRCWGLIRVYVCVYVCMRERERERGSERESACVCLFVGERHMSAAGAFLIFECLLVGVRLQIRAPHAQTNTHSNKDYRFAK